VSHDVTCLSSCATLEKPNPSSIALLLHPILNGWPRYPGYIIAPVEALRELITREDRHRSVPPSSSTLGHPHRSEISPRLMVCAILLRALATLQYGNRMILNIEYTSLVLEVPLVSSRPNTFDLPDTVACTTFVVSRSELHGHFQSLSRLPN
jgi:hypothetical protein